MKYFLYARKSKESEDRQALSISAQLEECRQFARKGKLDIVKVFRESQTAKEPSQPVFKEMITLI